MNLLDDLTEFKKNNKDCKSFTFKNGTKFQGDSLHRWLDSLYSDCVTEYRLYRTQNTVTLLKSLISQKGDKSR
jgi:hypothetical protein